MQAKGIARRRSSGAFTLIELLVATAIIILLISIILPALSLARDAARASQCVSNQHQVHIGFVNAQSQFKSGLSTIKVTSSSWTGTILPYLNGEAGVYRCPKVPRSSLASLSERCQALVYDDAGAMPGCQEVLYKTMAMEESAGTARIQPGSESGTPGVAGYRYTLQFEEVVNNASPDYNGLTVLCEQVTATSVRVTYTLGTFPTVCYFRATDTTGTNLKAANGLIATGDTYTFTNTKLGDKAHIAMNRLADSATGNASDAILTLDYDTRVAFPEADAPTLADIWTGDPFEMKNGIPTFFRHDKKVNAMLMTGAVQQLSFTDISPFPLAPVTAAQASANLERWWRP